MAEVRIDAIDSHDGRADLGLARDGFVAKKQLAYEKGDCQPASAGVLLDSLELLSCQSDASPARQLSRWSPKRRRLKPRQRLRETIRGSAQRLLADPGRGSHRRSLGHCTEAKKFPRGKTQVKTLDPGLCPDHSTFSFEPPSTMQHGAKATIPL